MILKVDILLFPYISTSTVDPGHFFVKISHKPSVTLRLEAAQVGGADPSERASGMCCSYFKHVKPGEEPGAEHMSSMSPG